MTVITITDALGKGKTAAKKQDMLIAAEAMEIREELEELLYFHAFDKWEERYQRGVVGQHLTLAVGDVHAGTCVPVISVPWESSICRPGWNVWGGTDSRYPSALIRNCIWKNTVRHVDFTISDQRFTPI